MTKKYAVLGNPIAHSLSPQIHQAFAQQFAIDISYERILVPPGKLKAILDRFQQGGGLGVNVTMPLKEEAWKLLHTKTPRAERAGAVNTIKFNGESWQGDNTDGVGLVRDLVSNKGLVLRAKRILIIGAGGATRGILAPLLEEKPEAIVIANRTLAKAQQLAQDFQALGTVSSCDLNELCQQKADLIIQATSAGTKGEIIHLPANIAPGAVCYDLAYGDSAKAFLDWAKTHGARLAYDGFGMLVEQAGEAFYSWHNKHPETKTVIQRLTNRS
jgi:shikimate dehydrogenase